MAENRVTTREMINGLAAAATLAAFAADGAQAQPSPRATPEVIGLVLGEWKFALHETPNGKIECPQGFQFDLTANYNAEYPTPEARILLKRSKASP